MAVVTTKAIVLSALKFGDSSLIVKCFTEEEGVKSYLIRGILKAKKGGLKAAYFQPLTQLTIVASHNNKGTLNSIKEVQVSYPYQTIYRDIVKQSVVLFLSEVLSYAIKEEEKNEGLYEYLESGLIWLDLHDKIANFHLLFLLNLTRFLGFYPDLSDADKLGFDLSEGVFSDLTSQKNLISGNYYYQFKKLLGITFDEIENVSFGKQERQIVLKIIIQYFELHLDGFRKPKSLQILETVFS
ncbi:MULTISPECIES: DNA repair protein RecO [Polaribacter]|jgi:DNA repair protein RecO (recombination protein O)|uniref:DNA repair protein RecO n=1 Tax=Polaribacter sejongensis TaxID=985043 RepID=A0AAJ1R025_9FLAO|nr:MULTISPECIES: DNA repair protein RecO [Polaribacter]MDN3620912.1 DNA repair protein RecO [Polaribacter undariae]QXP63470.1 DNA repair protein RecO [Polaribacter sp. HaHaR_3_91]QXP65978.1 DNA repair protein RecO [Polaribacter sp. AHE13PA]UWD31045.1 DNA repair protein RecO [Polaribacter undariae]